MHAQVSPAYPARLSTRSHKKTSRGTRQPFLSCAHGTGWGQWEAPAGRRRRPVLSNAATTTVAAPPITGRACRLAALHVVAPHTSLVRATRPPLR